MKLVDEIISANGHKFLVHFCSVENVFIITSEVTGIYELILHNDKEKDEAIEFFRKANFV